MAEVLSQRHGAGSGVSGAGLTNGFLRDDAQGVLAHFTSGVTADMILMHEGAAGILIDSAEEVSIDAAKSSNMNIAAAGNASGEARLSIGVSHSGTDATDTGIIDVDAKSQVDITVGANGTGANALRLLTTSGGFDLDCGTAYDLAVANSMTEVVTAGGASRDVQAGDLVIKHLMRMPVRSSNSPSIQIRS